MTDVPLEVKRLLERVFTRARERRDAQEYNQLKSDFVFHMTDWHTDLEGLCQLFVNADEQDEDSACEFVIGFLYHVIPHLNAAGKLLLDEIPDPFAESETRDGGTESDFDT